MRIPAIAMLAATSSAFAANQPTGGLTISGPKCGELQCAMTEYCNFSERCEDCNLICDTGTHNFDETICLNSCQNYLHDLRYMKISSENSNLTATVASLEKQVHTLTLTCSILLFFVIALGLAVVLPRSKGFYNWISQKFQKKKVHCATAFTHENPHTESPVAPHRVRTQQTNIIIPTPISQETSRSEDDESTVRSPNNNNNTSNVPVLNNTMAFTISNPGALSHSSEYERINRTNPTLSTTCHSQGESQIPLQSSTPMETTLSDSSFIQRSMRDRDLDRNDEIALNVRSLNRFTSSHCTLPDTPETQSTRVEDLYLGTHTTRLPSEDCIVELKENNVDATNCIEYNSPQRQVIYTTLPQNSH